MTWLGVAVLAGYAVHAGYHLWRGEPEDLLWMCHLGAAAVGVGLCFRWPRWNAIGLLFLTVGVPLWTIDLLGGGQFAPTSLLTHGLGLRGRCVGSATLGHAHGRWWQAWLALLGIFAFCRLATPPRANVNLAFSMHPGSERLFLSPAYYLPTLLLVAGAGFYIFASAYRRWTQPRQATA